MPSSSALLLLAACAPRAPSVERVRSACGVDLEDKAPWTLERSMYDNSLSPPRLSEDCVSLLAQAIHLDWEDFGEAPHSLDREDDTDLTVAEETLLMVYSLIYTELGTWREAEALYEGGPAYLRRIERAGRRRGLGPEDDVSEYIYYFVGAEVRRTVRMPREDWSLTVGATFNGLTGTLSIRNADLEQGGGQLLHEAMHSYLWSFHDMSCKHLRISDSDPYARHQFEQGYKEWNCDRSDRGLIAAEAWYDMLWERKMSRFYQEGAAYSCRSICHAGDLSYCKEAFRQRGDSLYSDLCEPW